MATDSRIGILSEPCRKTIEWRIDNFFNYTKKYTSYRSPEFLLSDLSWHMEIYPNGSNRDSADYVSLFMNKGDSHSSVEVEYEFGIKALNGEIINKKDATWKSTEKGWGYPKFIKKSELESEKLKLVPSDTLILTCAINLKNIVPDTEARMMKLASDFKDMFISEKHCDASIKIEGEIIPVHKSVLASRSPVFAAMFENDMSEKESGVVDISDCDPAIFKDFLLYLYSGNVDFPKSKLCDLYKIAHKYDVPDLKLICIDFMIRNICVENLFEYCIFGHLFDETDLITEVQTFFNENLKAILCSPDWIPFFKEHSDLANDLLIKMSEYEEEEEEEINAD